jgi:single-strand DNA-binding protein
MRDINIVVLVGRLTRDAELKYTNSGQSICRFSVAVNRNRKQGDQWVDEASFFDVDYWGKGGEAVNQYLTKGKQVAIEGELRQDRWEQDGQSRSKVIVNATNVQLLGSAGGGSGAGSPDRGAAHETGARPADQGSQAPRAARGPTAGQGAARPQAAPSDDFTDDIPF